MKAILVLTAVAIALFAVASAAPSPIDATLGAPASTSSGRLQELKGDAEAIAADPTYAASNPDQVLKDVTTSDDQPNNVAPPQDPVNPGFADGIRNAFHDQMVMAGLTSLFVAGLGIAGFAMVTRYVKPEEALANPQRSMLYGFIRGNPGVHLKRLSDEFSMKTSSILWHIRKLENAELVRSDRANGFRVFYPTAGGVEMKVVSRATTALQNHNARQVFDALEAKPGSSSGELARSTGIHAGTVRWHLRKLREYGLVQEVEGQGDARYFATAVGTKAVKTMTGAPGGVQAPAATPAVKS